MRVVLDTAAMVAASRSRSGASRRLLIKGIERQVTLLVSVPLMIEYEAVLTRPEHLSAASMSREEVVAILDAVAATAEPVRLEYLWRPALRDADDDMVLETAANDGAQAIVTFSLRDFSAAAGRFGIHAVTPGDALAALEDRR